jgi:amino acid transporter
VSDQAPESGLNKNAIGLAEVLFQSVTAMAPASAVAFSLGAAVPFAGSALPLATLIALAVCMLIAFNIAALAKHLPSAGGYFTYVSHGLDDRAGWLTGWLFSLAYVLIVPLVLLVLGPLADDFVKQHFHVALGWLVWAVLIAVVPLALTFFGVKLSSDSSVVLGTIEIVILFVLSAWLIATGEHASIRETFSATGSLEPGLAGWQGILHGMIFAFLAFAGFESAAPMAEEARDPRHTVPRAIVLATLCIGVFYAFCSYAAVAGWGTAKMASFTSDPNPWGTMANRVWGTKGVIIVFAILNSGLGNAVAGINAASRSMFAMSRAGTLPGPLAHIHPRHQTPDIAIFTTVGLGMILTVWLGVQYGPATAFALVGTIVTLLILVVYLATCLSVPLFYYREHRMEFSIGRHVIVPVIPAVALIFPIWVQFVPAPAPPLNLAGPVCGVWLVFGLLVAQRVRRRNF